MRYYTMLPASITCRRCKHESSKSLYIYCRWSIPTEVRFVPYPVCTYCRIKDRAGAAVRAARARQHQIPDEELKEALGHEMHGYIKLAAAPLAEHGLMDPRQLEVLKMWAAYCVDLKVRFGASWPVRIGSFPPAGELIALPASPAETEDAAGERPFYDPIRDSTRD